jgi:hypothetical protein
MIQGIVASQEASVAREPDRTIGQYLALREQQWSGKVQLRGVDRGKCSDITVAADSMPFRVLDEK